MRLARTRRRDGGDVTTLLIASHQNCYAIIIISTRVNLLLKHTHLIFNENKFKVNLRARQLNYENNLHESNIYHMNIHLKYQSHMNNTSAGACVS